MEMSAARRRYAQQPRRLLVSELLEVAFRLQTPGRAADVSCPPGLHHPGENWRDLTAFLDCSPSCAMQGTPSPGTVVTGSSILRDHFAIEFDNAGCLTVSKRNHWRVPKMKERCRSFAQFSMFKRKLRGF